MVGSKSIVGLILHGESEFIFGFVLSIKLKY